MKFLFFIHANKQLSSFIYITYQIFKSYMHMKFWVHVQTKQQLSACSKFLNYTQKRAHNPVCSHRGHTLACENHPCFGGGGEVMCEWSSFGDANANSPWADIKCRFIRRRKYFFPVCCCCEFLDACHHHVNTIIRWSIVTQKGSFEKKSSTCLSIVNSREQYIIEGELVNEPVLYYYYIVVNQQ